jgi:hypothetical protein
MKTVTLKLRERTMLKHAMGWETCVTAYPLDDMSVCWYKTWTRITLFLVNYKVISEASLVSSLKSTPGLG